MYPNKALGLFKLYEAINNRANKNVIKTVKGVIEQEEGVPRETELSIFSNE